MPRPHRYTDDHVPGGHVFEFMLRTVGSVFLLRPDDTINAVIVGEFAQALAYFKDVVRVHEVVCQSNHIHGLISAACQEAIEDFMEYFVGNLAVKIIRLREWNGRVWGARYSLSQVFPSAQRRRQTYLWKQGLPENLYASPSDNPCVSTYKAWSKGKLRLKGTRYDGTAMCKAGVGWHDPRREAFGEAVWVDLHPLPIDEGKTKAQLVEQAREEGKRLKKAHAKRRAKDGLGVLGADKMRAMSPFARPKKTKRGRAAPLAYGTEAEVADFKARHAAAANKRDRLVVGLVRDPATDEYPEKAAMPSELRKAIHTANDQDLKIAELLFNAGHPEEAEAVLAASPRRRPKPKLPDAPVVPRGARNKRRRSKTPKRRRPPTPRADRLRRRGRVLLRVGPKRRRRTARVLRVLRTLKQRALPRRVIAVPPAPGRSVAHGPKLIRLLIRPAVEAQDDDGDDAVAR